MSTEPTTMSVTDTLPVRTVTESLLPSYDRPPVDETALSIQFAPITGFEIAHFGVYWTKIRDRYPRIESHPPIANVTEQFGEGQFPGNGFGFAFATMPEVRCWYLDQPGNRLVQLQKDRLVYNWRRVAGNEEYPRYDPSIRDSLITEWEAFCSFLADEKLPVPKATQCEITYVNHIEYGDGWKNYGELHRVITALNEPNKTHTFLPNPERMNMQLSYLLEKNMGRLYVSFVPVIRTRDGKEVLQMSLTARGAPTSSSNEDIVAWFDQGRNWIVRCFSEFTTEEMQKHWGKR